MTYPDPEWRRSAACASVGGDVFFPEKGSSPIDAKRICQRCPVRSECLEDALANDEHFGVWGGKTPHQRLQLQRDRRRRLPRRHCDVCGQQFEHLSAQQRMCSDPCRVLARRQTRAKSAMRRA